MAGRIHPTAIIEPGARLGEDVEVGAYAYVGSGVVLGDRTRLHHHASVEGDTWLGAACEVFPYACIGGRTQDLKFAGGRPGLRVRSAGDLFDVGEALAEDGPPDAAVIDVQAFGSAATARSASSDRRERAASSTAPWRCANPNAASASSRISSNANRTIPPNPIPSISARPSWT